MKSSIELSVFYKKLITRYFFCLAIILLCGCSVNYENILITGKVMDSVTRKPVVGAVVIGDCMFYDSEIVDYDFDGDTVLTDREGKFKLVFDEGVVIDLQVSAPGYSRKKIQFTLTSNKESIKIELDAEE